MTNKSVLNEIDRLEGIAQAYKRARPGVFGQGILGDCGVARNIVEEIEEAEGEVQGCREKLKEAQGDVIDAVLELDVWEAELERAQRDLDNLMASLSARLER